MVLVTNIHTHTHRANYFQFTKHEPDVKVQMNSISSTNTNLVLNTAFYTSNFTSFELVIDWSLSFHIKWYCYENLANITSNQSILKEISPGCSLEVLMLKLKLQYFGHLMWRVDSLAWLPDAGRDWGQEEKGMTEDEMAGWHHWLDGRESELTPGVGDGQGGLACCDSWGRKESDTTEQLNWTELTEGMDAS